MAEAWLAKHLAALGLGNPDGVSRAARMTRCPTCGRQTLVGLDADAAAMPVRCDPDEIDATGELVALMAGLHTYTLTRGTNSSGKAQWRLDYRDQWQIAAGQKTAIVAGHRCGIAIPPAAESHMPARYQPVPQLAEPDF